MIAAAADAKAPGGRSGPSSPPPLNLVLLVSLVFHAKWLKATSTFGQDWETANALQLDCSENKQFQASIGQLPLVLLPRLFANAFGLGEDLIYPTIC